MRGLGACATTVVLLAAAANADGRVERFRLENGLTVLVRPVAGTEDVAVVTFFAIGGDHDPEGRSGLAHLVEHLYVSAAAGEAPRRDRRFVEETYGSRFRAVTYGRFTTISCGVPAARLAAELADAAARMAALRIEEQDLVEERKHVSAEQRDRHALSRVAASRIAAERIRPAPFGAREGGALEDLERVTLGEARDRYRKYYKPRNAVLVLAGAVKAEDARALVERLFARLPAGEPAPDAAPIPPGRPGTETVRYPSLDGARTARYAWAAPDPASDDFPAFLVGLVRITEAAWAADWDVLASPLAAGTVVLAAPEGNPSADIHPVLGTLSRPWDPEADTSLEHSQYGFELGLACPPDHLLRGVGEFRTFLGQQDLHGLAFFLGLRETIRFDSGRLRERLKSLTEEDLQRVRQLFGRDRCACVVLEPEPVPK